MYILRLYHNYQQKNYVPEKYLEGFSKQLFIAVTLYIMHRYVLISE